MPTLAGARAAAALCEAGASGTSSSRKARRPKRTVDGIGARVARTGRRVAATRGERSGGRDEDAQREVSHQTHAPRNRVAQTHARGGRAGEGARTGQVRRAERTVDENRSVGTDVALGDACGVHGSHSGVAAGRRHRRGRTSGQDSSEREPADEPNTPRLLGRLARSHAVQATTARRRRVAGPVTDARAQAVGPVMAALHQNAQREVRKNPGSEPRARTRDLRRPSMPASTTAHVRG